MSVQYPASPYLARLEEWRRAMGLDHRQFASYLGRDESEWSRVRRGKRTPSRSFIATTISRAPEPWKSALTNAYLTDLTATAAA